MHIHTNLQAQPYLPPWGLCRTSQRLSSCCLPSPWRWPCCDPPHWSKSGMSSHCYACTGERKLCWVILYWSSWVRVICAKHLTHQSYQGEGIFPFQTLSFLYFLMLIDSIYDHIAVILDTHQYFFQSESMLKWHFWEHVYTKVISRDWWWVSSIKGVMWYQWVEKRPLAISHWG